MIHLPAKEKRRDLGMEALAVLSVALLSFLCALQAANNIWKKGHVWVDASVFQYVGRVIRAGGMPYRDTFDHKGPLVYLINALGQVFAEWRGVWFFELLAIFVTFLFMYKLARLYTGRGVSILLLVISGSTLFSYLDGGNLVEEYAMPFIAVSAYIFTAYFQNGTVNPFRLVVCGLSFGAILMLRPNMGALWLVMCVGVLAQCLREKRPKDLIPFLAWFLAGALVLLVPILVWLAVNGAFRAFLDDYLIFNLRYSSTEDYATLSRRVESFTYFMGSLMLVSICGLGYTWYKKKSTLDLLNLIYLVLSLLLMCMSGLHFKHYGMVLVPVFIYPLARTVTAFRDNTRENQLPIALFLIYLLVSFASSGWIGAVKNAAAEYDGRDKLYYQTPVLETVAMVDMNCAPDDEILVVGNWDIIYNLSNRFAASRYSYQTPPLSMDLERAEEFYAEVEKNRPKLIVLPLTVASNIFSWMCDYILANPYEEVGRTSDTTVIVYKLNEP